MRQKRAEGMECGCVPCDLASQIKDTTYFSSKLRCWVRKQVFSLLPLLSDLGHHFSLHFGLMPLFQCLLPFSFFFSLSVSTCLYFLLLPSFFKKEKEVLLTSSFQNSSWMYTSEEGEASWLALASVICSMYSWKSGLTKAGKSLVPANWSGGEVGRGKRSILGNEPARNSVCHGGSCFILVLKIQRAVPVILLKKTFKQFIKKKKIVIFNLKLSRDLLFPQVVFPTPWQHGFLPFSSLAQHLPTVSRWPASSLAQRKQEPSAEDLPYLLHYRDLPALCPRVPPSRHGGQAALLPPKANPFLCCAAVLATLFLHQRVASDGSPPIQSVPHLQKIRPVSLRPPGISPTGLLRSPRPPPLSFYFLSQPGWHHCWHSLSASFLTHCHLPLSLPLIALVAPDFSATDFSKVTPIIFHYIQKMTWHAKTSRISLLHLRLVTLSFYFLASVTLVRFAFCLFFLPVSEVVFSRASFLFLFS